MKTFKIQSGDYVFPAKQLDSSNCNDRPENAQIHLLVIHNISLPPGEFSGDDVEAFFLNHLDCSKHPYYARLKDMKVSAHLFIRRGGDVIQFVPFSKRAWHAGESSFQGVANCNDYSIGIELEGSDDQSFSDAQYATLASVTRAIMDQYPKITRDRIVGHSDIASGRKTDPGPCFDWAHYHSLLD